MAFAIFRDHSLASSILSPTILWFLVVVFVCLSGALFGIAIVKHEDSAAVEEARFTLLSQTFLQLLANYCTLVPILAYNIKRKRLSVNHYVFYFSTLASILTAIAAPIVFVQVPTSYASSILNFISNMLSIVTATQLAGGVIELGGRN